MENSIKFRHFGTMVDCSRNAVMKPETVNQWIDISKAMGYNTLLLYMEDTYEISNPYFGYGRGKYTAEELKDIDSYALSKGIEVIPCIQTLAHLNAIVDMPVFRDMVDTDDILLIGDERVYALIEDMFKSLAACLTTRHINIGMDEAHMVGRGKYYDINGEVDRTKLIVEHLASVAEIAKKYGFEVTMWSDMFFRLATNGNYYDADISVPEEIKALIPDNVKLCYWDYYHQESDHYKAMLRAHDKIKKGTWFAGGFWTWNGFAPLNDFSIKATKAAVSQCLAADIEDVFFTLWGDDTAECSKFAVLPSMFFAAEYAKGNRNMKSIKEKFKKQFGISFDAFMTLDLGCKDGLVNPSKYLLYNDLFSGKMDCRIKENAAAEFTSLARKLSRYAKNERWGYLFKTLSCLCRVAALKADLSFRIRPAYHSPNPEELAAVITDCKVLLRRMKEFYSAFEEQWMRENKPQGFDVQDIRLGGMIVRTEHCIKRLEAFAAGKLEKLEELEEAPLEYYGNGTEPVREDTTLNSFKKIFTTNILTW